MNTPRPQQRQAKKLAIWTLIAAAGALLLYTAALVLWYPIDQAAITRADNAGWNESLLLPHQFLITTVLLGGWVCSLGAVVASAFLVHAASSRPRQTLSSGTAHVDLPV